MKFDTIDKPMKSKVVCYAILTLLKGMLNTSLVVVVYV